MPNTMQAVVKAERAPGIVLREVPVPTPGPGEVLVRVEAVSVCGTDLHIYNWDSWAQKTIPVPMVVGHVFVGRIVEAGANV
jgi:threonine 3-dehydrogenase